MTPRIFHITVTDEYMHNIVSSELLSDPDVMHTFNPIQTVIPTNFPYGEYWIVVPAKCKVNLDKFKQYELIPLNREAIEEFKNKNKTFKEIDSVYHKQIEEEFSKRLEEKRKEFAKDIIHSYQSLFDEYINGNVYRLKCEFLDKFDKEQCTYEQLCNLYKDKINAEIELKFESILSNISDPDKSQKYYYISNYPSLCQETKKYILNEIKDYLHKTAYFRFTPEVEKDIHEAKNRITDRILKMWNAKQGTLEYHIAFRHAGKLADIIESYLWKYYDLGRKFKQ